MPAILTVMADRQDLYNQLGAFGDSPAGGIGEDALQAIGIEDPATANFNVDSEDAVGGMPIGRLIHDFQDVIRNFAFVHARTSFPELQLAGRHNSSLSVSLGARR